MSRTSKAVAALVRRSFRPRFQSFATRLDSLEAPVNRMAPLDPNVKVPAISAAVHELGEYKSTLAEVAQQAAYLGRVDVSEHNRDCAPPNFSQLRSQAVSAAQCEDPTYLEWFRMLTGLTESETNHNAYNRKTWEWAYIAEAVAQAGLMKTGLAALGFGVGNEPLPALFASRGLNVTATDQGVGTDDDWESAGRWASTGQLMTGLSDLSRPHLINDEELASRVEVRDVDMNNVPTDLGTFDVIWSSCVIEHLGSPERGLDFVLESCRLLTPGGIAVHTTELELTRRESTADYGNCAVYRILDLRDFAKRLSEVGCTSSFNFTVPMDSPEDRWVSLVLVDESAPPDIAHLKLAIDDSVSTSFGLLIRRLS